MENKKIVNFIPHTHWDREWYFTINDASLLSTLNFEKVLDVLENNKDFPAYCLDGQTSIIEDSLELKPELRDRLVKLVKERRIFLGPWHTQTDSFYTDGESYIRNLYFGSMLAEELGHSMQLGYLPDTFGHNIQTPQLFKGFGLDTALFWRGRDPKKLPDTYFTWKGLDGSEVLALNLMQGYSLAQNITNEKEEWDNKIIPLVEKLSRDTKFNNLLMPTGGDQDLIDDNLPNILKELDGYMGDDYEVKLTDYETFIKDLREEIGDLSKLQVWNDEFRWPERARVHRTIGSSRYDLKKKSFTLEHKLINILEPLSIIVYKTVDKDLINKHVTKKAWKLLLDGHAHDSLGACNTDITNENVLNRFKRAENLIDGTINLFKKIIGTNIGKLHDQNLVLYNFDTKELNKQYREVILFSTTNSVKIYDGDQVVPMSILNVEEIGAKDAREVILTPKGDIEVPIPPYYQITARLEVNIKPFGYKSYKLVETEENISQYCDDYTIENDNLKLEITNNNINVTNKRTSKIYNHFITIENVANDGDSYDFSPIKDDQQITNWRISNVSSRKLDLDIHEVVFKADIEIPTHLVERKSRSSEKVKQEFEFKIFLQDENIDFTINTTNRAKDHRFRLKFNNLLGDSDSIHTDVPFGFIERSYEKEPENWKDFMVEKPVNYFPIINTFFTRTGQESILVNTKGLKEIEIKENKDIYLTLYKSDGWLGKNDLELRPNRASGINNILVPSPDAQLYNVDLQFDFRVSFAEADVKEKDIVLGRKEYLTKFDYYQLQTIDKFKDRLERFQVPIKEYNIKKELSLFNEEKDLTLISSYLSYKSDSVVLRYANFNEEVISLNGIISSLNAEVTNFAEVNVDDAEIPQYRLTTLKLK